MGLAVCGCGSSGSFANKPRPASPVNLTVYINNARVSVSPGSVGAGPVTFIVANHANSSQALMIDSVGSGGQLAKTGPINPQGTASVNVAFTKQGQYRISTGSGASTEASTASPTGSIAPATITVGPTRQNSRGDLNVP